MPTMNTRERPAPPADGGEQLLLVADGAVGQEHHLAQMRRVDAWRSVSAARIAGTISVPPVRLEPADEGVGPADILASAGTASGNSMSMVSSKRMTLKRSAGFSRPSAVDQAVPWPAPSRCRPSSRNCRSRR